MDQSRSQATWAVLGAIAGIGAIWMLKVQKRFDLSGKIVLITGGSRGLGLVLAREFLRRGSTVAICARDEAELDRVKAEFTEVGDRFSAFRCDVGDRDQVQKLIENVESRLGMLDVVVNNAGNIQV